MPLVPLPAPAVRRAEVVELLRRITYCALPPTNAPHQTWKDALSLVMDLLLGFGKRRYFKYGQGVATGNKGEHKGVLGR